MSILSKIKGKASNAGHQFARAYLPAPTFIYMHLPKTAGSAIKKAVGNSAHSDDFRLQPHVIGFEHLTAPERRSQTFVTIRHPLDWYLSIFNFKIHSKSDKGYDEMATNELDDFLADHIDFANGAEGIKRWNQPAEFKRHMHDIADTLCNSASFKKVGFCTATFLYYSHPDWRAILNDPDAHAHVAAMIPGQNCVSHVLRQETLQEECDLMLSGKPYKIDLSQRVNQMAENKYHALINDETRAKIAQLDRGLIEKYYPTGPAQ